LRPASTFHAGASASISRASATTRRLRSRRERNALACQPAIVAETSSSTVESIEYVMSGVRCITSRSRRVIIFSACLGAR
jgi:hypothetical protein